MGDYALTVTDHVIRTRDGASIPDDPANRDRVDYVAWIAAGNVPDPYVPPPAPVPQTVSRMQALVALRRAGLLSAVQTWVDSQDAETQLIWTNAPDFSRNSTLLGNAATALGLTSDQVDALFVTAASINP